MLTCGACGRESPPDFTFCPACGGSLAPERTTHEVRKTVTIVFCDVTGSTALGERLDPEPLRNVMTRYFEVMRGVIERHGGSVEKFIGDAVMAVFGVPAVHEDDALRAVSAAVEMQAALEPLNEQLTRDHGAALSCRIGVNTGEVVAGTGDQTVATGDAVNVAARLEQAAPPGEVLIGASTFELVRDAVEAEPVPALTLKGKKDPVPAYRVTVVVPGSAGRARRMDTEMVGRARELGILHQAFERTVEDRSCQLFTVLAPAGIGKSRLIQEFLTATDGARVLQGRCLAYGDGITYFPVTEVLKEAAGLADFDAPEVVESKVCAVLEGEEHAERACGLLGQLLGIGESEAPEETFWAIRRFLEAIAREGPAVVVFDDIHWGEPVFLDFVEHMADWSREVPILLICMARPELLDVRPTWGGGKLNATTISLQPLSDRDCAELITGLLGHAPVALDVTTRIAGAAEGTPLFVEEMLAMLADDGVIVQEEGTWVSAGDLEAVSVPPSIQALLAARLDRLAPGERSVIERAAVVGSVFYRDALHELFDGVPAEVIDADLLALVRKELIRPDRSTLPGQDAFRFRHQLVLDAAYEAMPMALRAELHERVAGWLKARAGDRLAEQEEIVAYHLGHAYALRSTLGPPDARALALAAEAGTRYAACGRRAFRRGDLSAGAEMTVKAIGLLPLEGPERPEALLALATGIVNPDKALDIAGELRRPTSSASGELYRRVADLWEANESIMGNESIDPRKIRRAAVAAADISLDLGRDDVLASALMGLANVEWVEGRMKAMCAAAERAIDTVRRSPNPPVGSMAASYTLQAMALGTSPTSQVLRRADELLATFEGERVTELMVLTERSAAAGAMGRHEQARRDVEAAYRILEDLGLPDREGFVLSADALVDALVGDHERWEAKAVAVVEVWGRGAEAFNQAYVIQLVARSRVIRGRFDEAAESLTSLRALLPPGRLVLELPTSGMTAAVAAAHGDAPSAQRALAAGESALRATEMMWELAFFLFEKAITLQLLGRMPEAESAAREALELFERKELVVFAGWVTDFIAGLS